MKRIALAIAAVAAVFALLPAAASAAAPTATTGTAANVTTTSATVSSSIDLNGGSYVPGVDSCELQYGTTTSYTATPVPCPTTPSGTSTAETFSLSNLTPGTLYHYNVLVTTGAAGIGGGTSATADQTFTTPASGSSPTLTPTAASSVAGVTATVNGTLDANNWTVNGCAFVYKASGGSAQTAPCVPGSGDAVSANLTNLTQGTAYTYNLEVSYGSTASPQTETSSSSGSFTTTAANLGAPGDLTATGALLQGSVLPEGQAVSACTFYYGTTLTNLKQMACSVAPSGITASPTLVTASLTGLSPKTTYIQVLVLTTSGGGALAPISTFTTPAAAVAKVTGASATGAGAATLRGSIDAGGEAIKGCEFLYGTAYLATAAGAHQGKTVACATTPADTGTQTVTANVKNLTPGKRYYEQLFVLTAGGLTGSSVTSFTTSKLATPAVRISRAVINAKSRSASFTFGRSGSTSITKGYQCALATVKKGKVGKLTYRACSSPKRYAKLAKGSYEFSLRAGNAAGYGSARNYRFTI